jgi:hypothetical protein
MVLGGSESFLFFFEEFLIFRRNYGTLFSVKGIRNKCENRETLIHSIPASLKYGITNLYLWQMR